MPEGSLWNPTSSSMLRRPRLRLLINDVALKGCISASVTANNRLAANTWEADIDMSEDIGYGWKFWGDQTDATIKIQAAFEADGANEGDISDWTTLIIGKCDDIHVDPVQSVVHLSGRDLISLLIDTKIQKAFPNKTTSQILTEFAQEHGLKADVTPTTTFVGTYYKDEHDKLSLGNFSKQTSEWELACYLVKQEDQDIWIDDAGLHTRPAIDPQAAGVKPFPIIYVGRDQDHNIPSANACKSMQAERSLTIAKDIRVTVKSWDAAHKKSYTRTVDGKGSFVASKSGAGSRGRAAPMQEYVFIKPNKTPDDALKFAQQQAKILTMLERVCTLEMPGELELSPRSLVSLSGTGTSWDQVYYVDNITRRISWDSGFTQTVRLKNSSPRTQTTVS